MSFLDHLPEPVGKLIQTRFVCEWATVSAAGVPIDTPLVPFTSADLETIDAATGLAYPVKAERARRNPKVGMLFEGGPKEPVVSISGIAAVRDSDFQANLERYLAEEILTSMLDPAKTDYASVTRHAIWYFTRIVICAKPCLVRWWDTPDAMDAAPREWRAAEGTQFPQSDPSPPGAASKSPWRAGPDWRDVASAALGRRAPAHLTLVDAEGFPLPVRARKVRAHAEGFSLEMPGWLPWREGRASLTFQGIETFIGTACVTGGEALFRAERVLPIHPLMSDPSEILAPRPETKQELMARIGQELQRRGARLPRMPDEPPEPTKGARLRAEAAFSFGGFDGKQG